MNSIPHLSKIPKIAILLIIIAAVFCLIAGTIFFFAGRAMGFGGSKRYFILLQNNFEIRPTGGFLGSYAKLTVEKGKIIDLSIQDIYTPDGQIQGHVDPPQPIQDAFGQGWFRLRDANFDPDFPTAVQTLHWFFEKGGEAPVDGTMAVNMEVFGAFLDVMGPLAIPDESEKLTKDNFYKIMQSEVEMGFFPGSHQKKTYLSKVAKASLFALEHATLAQRIALFQKGIALLQEKHILLSFQDPFFQKIIAQLHFDGKLYRPPNVNYFAVIEANLGTNKANCCISREVELSHHTESEKLLSKAKLVFRNTNEQRVRQPPLFWGGSYLTYVRVYIPSEATVTALTIAGETRTIQRTQKLISQEEPLVSFIATPSALATHSAMQRVDIKKDESKQLQSVGFFVYVDAKQEAQVLLQYEQPATTRLVPLFIQKQSGISSYPFTFIDSKRNSTIELTKDTLLLHKFQSL